MTTAYHYDTTIERLSAFTVGGMLLVYGCWLLWVVVRKLRVHARLRVGDAGYTNAALHAEMLGVDQAVVKHARPALMAVHRSKPHPLLTGRHTNMV